MKSAGFFAGLAIGLLGLVTFVWSSRSATTPVVPLDRLHETGWLQEQLRLDEGQVQRVAELQSTYAAEVVACCANHCGARKQLGEAVFTEGRDPTQLTAMVESMCKAQMESDLATIRHIQAIHAVLRPDQQKTYEKLVASCVCADCPHCAEHTP